MATTQGNKLATGFAVQSAVSAAYTAPATVSSGMVTFASARNYGVTTETLTIYVLPSGETLADNYKAVIAKSLKAGETTLLMEIIGEAFAAGDTIQAEASTSDKISLDLVGSLVTA